MVAPCGRRSAHGIETGKDRGRPTTNGAERGPVWPVLLRLMECQRWVTEKVVAK